MVTGRIPNTPSRGVAGEGAAVEAVDRAVRVLVALAARPASATLAEIAARADLSKPTAFRILATLIAEGLAAQNAQTGSYRLGAAPMRIAARVLGSTAVRGPALAPMRELRNIVKETVVLSVREGDSRYNIDAIEAENAIGQAQRIGFPIPLYAGAASRVLLAGMESEELLAYLARTPLTPIAVSTIVDRDELLTEVKRAREQGYAVSTGEFAVSGYAVAKAIRNVEGCAIAAIHVSVPRSRYSPRVEELCVEGLTTVVAEIEAALATAQVSGN